MDIHVRSESVHRNQAEVASKIAGILNANQYVAESVQEETYQSRQGQTIAKSSHRSFEVTSLEVLIDVLALHRRVHVCPNKGDGTPCNASTLVRDLDGYVFLAFHNDHFDGWIYRASIVVNAISLNDRTQRVFEQLKTNV
jgi:hypothetical protein